MKFFSETVEDYVVHCIKTNQALDKDFSNRLYDWQIYKVCRILMEEIFSNMRLADVNQAAKDFCRGYLDKETFNARLEASHESLLNHFKLNDQTTKDLLMDQALEFWHEGVLHYFTPNIEYIYEFLLDDWLHDARLVIDYYSSVDVEPSAGTWVV